MGKLPAAGLGQPHCQVVVNLLADGLIWFCGSLEGSQNVKPILPYKCGGLVEVGYWINSGPYYRTIVPGYVRVLQVRGVWLGEVLAQPFQFFDQAVVRIRFGSIGNAPINHGFPQSDGLLIQVCMRLCCSGFGLFVKPDFVPLVLGQSKYGIPRVFHDYRVMLKERDIEMVTIAAPNALHARMTIDAAHAGKHVVCEKPLCMTLEEADEMIDVCRRQGVLLMYAEELFFTPKYVQAKRMADEGAFG